MERFRFRTARQVVAQPSSGLHAVALIDPRLGAADLQRSARVPTEASHETRRNAGVVG